jgi:hypothetical protein
MVVLVTCVAGMIWGCGDDGETSAPSPTKTSTATKPTTSTNTKDAGGAGGGSNACETKGGDVFVSPTNDGTCNLDVIKKIPGCNHKECGTCTQPTNCLPVCCVCDDGKTQYAATGCLNPTGKPEEGTCMIADDVCNDANARATGCAHPAK